MVLVIHFVGGAAGAGAGGVALLEVSASPDPKMVTAEAESGGAVVMDLMEVP